MNLDAKILTLTPLNNARLVHGYFDALDRFTQLASTAHSEEALLESFLDLLTDLLQAEQAAVMFLDPVNDELTVRASRGVPGSEAAKCRLKPGEGIAGRVLQEKEIYMVSGKDPAPARFRRAPHEPEATLYLPLLVGYDVQGVILLGGGRQERFFTAGEAKVAAALATHLVLAMENTQLSNQLSGLSLNFLKTLALAIDARDHYTRMHSVRVTRYAVMTGVRMGLPQDSLELLRRGALLHDIGKIGVPDGILLKPGGLTKEEHDKLRQHPEIGAKILEPEGPLRLIVPMVLHHHERYDGTGYPHGLKGMEIPMEARIIAVADAYEAMTADRPYRKAFQVKKAVREIQRHAGSQFDPEIVKLFMDVLKDDVDE